MAFDSPIYTLGLHLDPAELQAAVKLWLGMKDQCAHSVHKSLWILLVTQCHADMLATCSSDTITCETFLQSLVTVLTCLYMLRLIEAFRESKETLVQQMCWLMNGKGQNLQPFM